MAWFDRVDPVYNPPAVLNGKHKYLFLLMKAHRIERGLPAR
jgi:hypothetical protein